MKVRSLLVLPLGLFAVACVSRQDIEEIKKTQKDILAKLDKVNAGPIRPQQQPPQQPRGPDPGKTYAFPIGDAPVKGAKDAWVTIAEISDFQCPYCKRVGPTMKEIEDKYGSDVRVAFIQNPLPFHNRATPAANASLCANEQHKFWPMHDALFENNRALEDTDIENYAKQVGLNLGKFKECYSANKYKSVIDGDLQRAGSFGARGTPAFFVNGRFLSGAQPFDAFKALIDEELQKAKSSGISKAEYYDKAVLGKGEKSI